MKNMIRQVIKKAMNAAEPEGTPRRIHKQMKMLKTFLPRRASKRP
jgi:hypothetical protein